MPPLQTLGPLRIERLRGAPAGGRDEVRMADQHPVDVDDILQPFFESVSSILLLSHPERHEDEEHRRTGHGRKWNAALTAVT